MGKIESDAWPSASRLHNTEPSTRPLDAELLCAFIQQTTHLDPHRKPGPQLVELLQTIFPVDAVAIFDVDLQDTYQAGEWFDDLDPVLQNTCLFQSSAEDPDTGLIRRVLMIGQLAIGAMLLRGEISPLVATALASVVAITFDRYHAFASESRTESARQTEQLRSTVLDSLAHAYKTPLTVIEAAGSGLAAAGSLSPHQAGLVALIEEQVEQLSQLTTRLLKTARLDSSDLVPRIEKVAVAPLIEDVVASLRAQLSSCKVEVVLSRDNFSLRCDRGLVVALLTQYLDNAAKYADAGSTVTIQAIAEPDAILFSVRSFGPLIPVADYERVFDRYFRSSVMTANHAPGTGLGLSVAKRAAQAHGGHVRVTSDARNGTTFYAWLPTSQEVPA